MLAGNVGPFTAVVGAPGANRSIVLEGGHLRGETALEHFHSLGSRSRLLVYAHVPGVLIYSRCACSSCIWHFHQFHYEPISSFTASHLVNSVLNDRTSRDNTEVASSQMFAWFLEVL